jgi:hypothetical protein
MSRTLFSEKDILAGLREVSAQTLRCAPAVQPFTAIQREYSLMWKLQKFT